MESGKTVLEHEHGMRVDIDTILRLKNEGATRVTQHPDGSFSVDFGPPAPPVTKDNQDAPSDPRKTYPRRPTGGLVTRAEDSDS